MDKTEYRQANFRANVVVLVVGLAIIITVKKYTNVKEKKIRF